MRTQLETPALLLDKPKLEANAARMTARADELGVVLRPHVKTLKSVEAAKIYAPQGSRITVSTLREAEVFAEAGYTDIFYAVGITPNKLERAAALVKAGVDLTLLLDTVEAAQAVSEASEKFSMPLAAMIEIDVDDHRAGISWDSDALIPIAQALTLNGRLRGVATHAGGSYDCTSLDAIADMAEQERELTVKAAERLRDAGFELAEVSVGSTPTALMARSFDGVTELRAGVYATFDLVMAGLGVCAIDDVAMSVLCSVIGHQFDKGWVLVDAGWMAMSRDLGTASQKTDQHYGAVCDAEGKLMPDYVVSAVNQEHGIITRRDSGPADESAFTYGAQFDKYIVLDDRGEPIAVWPRVNAW